MLDRPLLRGSGKGLTALSDADRYAQNERQSGTEMARSDSEIRDALNSRSLRLEPFDDKSLNPAGYDLRVDETAVLQPGEQGLVATMERVELGQDLVGVLHVRSSLAREGLIASLALVDPGFKGQLTISLFNSSRKTVQLRTGERFVQLTLVKLGRQAATKYEGRYQDSTGVVGSRR